MMCKDEIIKLIFNPRQWWYYYGTSRTTLQLTCLALWIPLFVGIFILIIHYISNFDGWTAIGWMIVGITSIVRYLLVKVSAEASEKVKFNDEIKDLTEPAVEQEEDEFGPTDAGDSTTDASQS